MEQFNDFGDILVPKNVPSSIEGESREYYRTPPGIYSAFIGKSVYKFKDAEGELVEPDTPGAIFSHVVLQLWFIKYFGSPDNPVGSVYIQDPLNSDKIVLPDRPIAECYFPVVVKTDPKWLWTSKVLFKRWSIPGHPQYDIIQPHPQNPAKFVLNLKGFPAYQGLICKFNIKEKKDTRYIDDEIVIVDYSVRIPKDKLKNFYELTEKIFQKEAEERKKQEGRYVREEVPDTDDESLESFLRG